ncbi:F-box protein skip19 [Trifolium pratense]|uniref:F-box protein skip19 n=1 Tax=Trifolium pratense TaxID=57577 RepID=A0A2K3JRM2_TRIPR|nr:F-box protein skip19 [Trifolium pratense]
MPGLIHLDIKGGNLTNVGLLTILDKCPLLKSLDIRLCPFLNLSESLEKRCIDQINDLKLPDSIYDDSDSHLDSTPSDDDPYWFRSIWKSK